LVKVQLRTKPQSEEPSGGNLKKTLKLFTVVAAAATLVGVAVAPASQAAKPSACLALDTGGIDDHSFNASAWAGAQASKSIADVSYVVASASNPDYAAEVKSLVDKKCDLIIGVGFLITDAIDAAAVANPSIKFAQVDDPGLVNGKALPNLKGLTFATNQSAFLAGYLAAGYTKTGTVATYGGINIPPVSIYMDGYAKGVAYYNKVKGKSVKVLGWDTVKQDGTFVGGFSDSVKAAQISKNFEQQGADVIFPVAGGLEFATSGNSATSHKSVVIGVDSDMYASATTAGQRLVILNSATKGVGASVKAVIADVAANKFSNTAYVGTLANGGTGLAGYHDLGRKVPAALQAEIKALAASIQAGKVSVA
jgi:basic membrane protein A